MQAIAQKIGTIASAFLALLSLTGALAASDAQIHGLVTDNTGKPIRGAIVKATSGRLSISRYSQNDGRYEITVPTGSYEVSAEAYGFGSKKQTKDVTQSGDTNFSLSPRLDVTRLTGAELEALLPDNQQTRLIRSTCGGCHSFDTIIKRRGNTAEQWQSFLPTMTAGRMFQPQYDPAQLAALGSALEKYFGPDAPYFGPDSDPPKLEQIKHADISDAALKATIREYKVPGNDTWVHSVAVDPVRDIAWFSEYDYQSNKVGRFNISTETFEEYPVPTPKSVPHTPIVAKDGRLWMALDGPVDNAAKLVSVDPTSGKLTEYKWPGKQVNTHTVAVAPDGNLWLSSMSSSNEFLSFNVKSEQFKGYKHALPASYPEVSAGAYEQIPGEPSGISYDVAVDSKGGVWFTETRLGTIARLDPQTGETTEYKPPETPNMNGIMIDGGDNVWFSDFMGHKLGKLDPKTRAFKMYQPPTANARPYGIVEEKKTGSIWFADYNGNNITRFDPKTETFTQYPIPTHGAYPRFVGLDRQGRIWFAEWWSGKIGVVDPRGSEQLASR